VDGLQFAALYTLQHGLASQPFCGLDYGYEALLKLHQSHLNHAIPGMLEIRGSRSVRHDGWTGLSEDVRNRSVIKFTQPTRDKYNGIVSDKMMNPSAGLAVFDGKKYLNLETYRRSGKGVRTPVWFAVEPAGSPTGDAPRLYVYTTEDSGKAKRIRQSGTVEIAPCDARGNVSGEWLDAHARIVSGNEFALGIRLINQKYRPWKQILDLSALLFRRHERIMLTIQLV
jgi:PPOX class probable F420-dependent enzyme